MCNEFSISNCICNNFLCCNLLFIYFSIFICNDFLLALVFVIFFVLVCFIC